MVDLKVHSDVLAERLELLQLRGSVYCRSALGSPWQLRFEAHDAAVFHIVERGSADLEWPDGRTLRLEAGDFVLLTRGEAHTVSDPRGTQGARVPHIVMRETDPCRNETWCVGAPDAVLLCGVFTWLSTASHALLGMLTDVLHIRAAPWLDSLSALMALEVERNAPGLQSVIRRLTDVLFVQVVRHIVESDRSAVGWIAGLRDPRVNRALQAIHGAPMRQWTVAQLAQVAGQSRSAFSAQFKRLVGQAPLEYLTQWRVTIATRMLEVERTSIAVIAQRSGYTCEVAFHRAYKRVTGRTPGAVRRMAREPRARP